jgi:hypothetical protein
LGLLLLMNNSKISDHRSLSRLLILLLTVKVHISIRHRKTLKGEGKLTDWREVVVWKGDSFEEGSLDDRLDTSKRT